MDDDDFNTTNTNTSHPNQELLVVTSSSSGLFTNSDIIGTICSFLIDDGNSVIRLALTCKPLYHRILSTSSSSKDDHDDDANNANTSSSCLDPQFWKDLIVHRWQHQQQQQYCNSNGRSSSSIPTTAQYRKPTIMNSIDDNAGDEGSSEGTNNNDEIVLSSSEEEEELSFQYYQTLYIEKRQADVEAVRHLKLMVKALRQDLLFNHNIDDAKPITMVYLNGENSKIDAEWEHPSWNNVLFKNRYDCYDIILTIALRYFEKYHEEEHSNIYSSKTSSSSSSSSTSSSFFDDNRLLGFLAARCICTFHFENCFTQWQALLPRTITTSENEHENENNSNNNMDRSPSLLSQQQQQQLNEAYLLEEHVLLICEIQKTPLELLQRHQLDKKKMTKNQREVVTNGPLYAKFPLPSEETGTKLTEYAAAAISVVSITPVEILDNIVRQCKIQLLQFEMKVLNGQIQMATEYEDDKISQKLIIISTVLEFYGFRGNTKDYYNYKNVLLDHVLVSKLGMPITLCLVFLFVCRRLDIPVQLTGLPGHIVLGYDIIGTSNTVATGRRRQQQHRRSYIDVFNGCRILSRNDCQQIVASYGIGWREDFLSPMSNTMIIQRILNNLRNCHARNIISCHDLGLRLNLLDDFHEHLTDRDMRSTVGCEDLRVSRDLLRIYKLLPPLSSYK